MFMHEETNMNSKCQEHRCKGVKKLLIPYYNRFCHFLQTSNFQICFLFMKPEPCIRLWKMYSKDINPAYDSRVSNHNKNQFSLLRQWFTLRGRMGSRKMLQFLIR